MKDVQATSEALSLQKEHPALQNIKFCPHFSIFVGRFWPHNQCGSMRIFWIADSWISISANVVLQHSLPNNLSPKTYIEILICHYAKDLPYCKIKPDRGEVIIFWKLYMTRRFPNSFTWLAVSRDAVWQRNSPVGTWPPGTTRRSGSGAWHDD